MSFAIFIPTGSIVTKGKVTDPIYMHPNMSKIIPKNGYFQSKIKFRIVRYCIQDISKSDTILIGIELPGSHK